MCALYYIYEASPHSLKKQTHPSFISHITPFSSLFQRRDKQQQQGTNKHPQPQPQPQPHPSPSASDLHAFSLLSNLPTMGTELLRPQDCLSQHISLPPPFISRRRNLAANNAFSYRATRKPAPRPEQRKRLLDRKPSSDDSRLPRLLMEKVTILRRGESLDSNLKARALKKQGDALVVVGTQRLGPDPQMVPKQIRIADFKPVYAGSAFAVSPSPSALPLPSFFRKQAVAVDDSATRDLRRLLRLE